MIDILMIERGNRIYIWNELHSIVVVKFKDSSSSGRSPTASNQGNEENYIILLLREAQTSYLRMNTHRVGEHFKKMCLNKNSLFRLLLISLFVFLYIYEIL